MFLRVSRVFRFCVGFLEAFRGSWGVSRALGVLFKQDSGGGEFVMNDFRILERIVLVCCVGICEALVSRGLAF